MSSFIEPETNPATRVATPAPTIDDKSRSDILKKDAIEPTVAVAESDDATPTSEPVPALAHASTIRKLLLLFAFAMAQFNDAANNSALFPAIPQMAAELNIAPSETAWLISAYQLTFAAFLLVAGRISDVYSPKPAFVSGALILGLTHLGGGFVRQKVAILVLRALGGIGGALTIPSALSLIVQLFPDPKSQGRAIGVFGGSGAIGNILGLIIGAVFVQYTSWPWIFWFTAILAISVAIATLLLLPNETRPVAKVNFDVLGISMLASAMILFIFAVTSAAAQGWGTAYVLAPLIISLFLVAGFFFWESRIDAKDAAIPPKLWRFPNIPVLAAVAILPYFWWVSVFVVFTEWWQTFYGWSAISTAVHFLPLGVGAYIISNIVGFLPRWFEHKHILLFSGVLLMAASAMLPFANSPDTYWPIVFPAFIIGTWGCMQIYSGANIAIFAYTPPSMAGTVGAIYNSALQLGSAVGLSVVITIQTSIDAKAGNTHSATSTPTATPVFDTKDEWRNAFKGRSTVFWFMFAVVTLEVLSILVFFRTTKNKLVRRKLL